MCTTVKYVCPGCGKHTGITKLFHMHKAGDPDCKTKSTEFVLHLFSDKLLTYHCKDENCSFRPALREETQEILDKLEKESKAAGFGTKDTNDVSPKASSSKTKGKKSKASSPPAVIDPSLSATLIDPSLSAAKDAVIDPNLSAAKDTVKSGPGAEGTTSSIRGSVAIQGPTAGGTESPTVDRTGAASSDTRQSTKRRRVADDTLVLYGQGGGQLPTPTHPQPGFLPPAYHPGYTYGSPYQSPFGPATTSRPVRYQQTPTKNGSNIKQMRTAGEIDIKTLHPKVQEKIHDLKGQLDAQIAREEAQREAEGKAGKAKAAPHWILLEDELCQVLRLNGIGYHQIARDWLTRRTSGTISQRRNGHANGKFSNGFYFIGDYMAAYGENGLQRPGPEHQPTPPRPDQGQYSPAVQGQHPPMYLNQAPGQYYQHPTAGQYYQQPAPGQYQQQLPAPGQQRLLAPGQQQILPPGQQQIIPPGQYQYPAPGQYQYQAPGQYQTPTRQALLAASQYGGAPALGDVTNQPCPEDEFEEEDSIAESENPKKRPSPHEE